MTRIFISYMREDRRPVNDLVAVMEANGLAPWIDRSDVQTGAAWRTEVRQMIAGSGYVVACFSSAYGAKRRSFFNREVKIALRLLDEVHAGYDWLLPVRLDNTPLPQISVEEGALSDLHYTDLFGKALAGNLHRLLSKLGAEQPDLSVLKRDGVVSLRSSTPETT